MFITKLFRHSKPMGVCFSAFILLFLLINYKWGLVATPVLQYGMYSGKYRLTDTITFYNISINGQPNVARMSGSESDQVQSYLDDYVFYKENNLQVYQTMSNYFSKFGLMPIATAEKFNVVVPAPTHYNWLKTKFGLAVDEPVAGFEASMQQFTWRNSALIPVDTAFKLSFVAAQ